jgi:antirestriction protein ArdC
MATVQEIITDGFVKALDEDTIPWMKPWAVKLPRNLFGKGNHYTGINLAILMALGTDELYVTYKQCIGHGGEFVGDWKDKRQNVVFYGSNDKKLADGSIEKGYTFLKYYKVYPVSATKGLEKYLPAKVEDTKKPIEECENFIKNLRAKIEHGGQSACFIPSKDEIHMPNFESFNDESSYYSTMFHELVHWTGHKSRMDRLEDTFGFGNHAYALEELVAEIGASFLCAEFGIANNRQIDNSKAYIQSWSKALKNDPKMVFKASAMAQKAVVMLLERAGIVEKVA